MCIMQIDILAVGKIKERYLLEGINSLSARIHRYVRCTITEIPDDRSGVSQEGAVKQSIIREGERILRDIPAASFIWVLDPAGRMYSSLSFAQRMNAFSIEGPHKVVFIIGGPHGLSRNVKQAADELLSLSLMTFPHETARFLLLEQIYRAFKINKGEPYHK